ncbi:uncharacterized protein EI90DRAFT_3079753 [Cantharellus anzutake]|uniref:uncharacterized protein n=1 Tax=Cantharellus anzutake TaxID=1750568 RepID=UPI001907A88C|nr:uncharacterized protein EI90DRAFT_3079753 [Cantharellus anzutake]KAF8320975.1 hypothetical protein EI90DRAFT_3079753 [Cantharellus anzutake]
MQVQDDLPPTPSTARPNTPGGFSIARTYTGTSAYFSTYETPTAMASTQQLPVIHAQDGPSPKYEGKALILDVPSTAAPLETMPASPPPEDVKASPTLPSSTDESLVEKSPANAAAATTDVAAQPPANTSSPTSPTSSAKGLSAYPENVDESKPIVVEPEADLSRHATGAFADGAATTRHPERTGTLHERAATAEAQLDEKTKSKILKAEGKNNKQMAKIIKAEAKAQDRALQTAIDELKKLQSVQKSAVTEESKALSQHTRAVAIEQRTAAEFAKIKAQYEKAQVELRSNVERLENARKYAKQTTEEVKEKNLQVLRATEQKRTDDRERAAQLATLGSGEHSKLCW